MAKKSNKVEFVKKANKVHNNKYDYHKFEYNSVRKKGIIVCPIHEEFLQTPASHLAGKGCPKCGRERSNIRNVVDTEKFITRSNKIHNNKYDYSKFQYVETRKKGIIICPIHGEFKQVTGEHLRGKGCPECGGNKKKKLEKFIFQSNKVHNNKYDYSKFKYVNNITKGIIICPIHNKFSQIPINHLAGRGCPECGFVSRIEKTRKCLDDFIKQANEVHNNKYDYSKSIYNGSFEKLIIVCPTHNEFTQRPSNHLCGAGCPDCGRIEANLKVLKTTEEFIVRAKIIHNDKYDYSKVVYIGALNKVIIICPIHGEFKQTPSNHLQGNRCFRCARSPVSKISQQWLDMLKIPQKYREKPIIISGKKYIVDAYNPKTNTIYEFYGDYWHGNLQKYAKNGFNSQRDKFFWELYEETISRENIIKSAGYRVISIWESEFIAKNIDV